MDGVVETALRYSRHFRARNDRVLELARLRSTHKLGCDRARSPDHQRNTGRLSVDHGRLTATSCHSCRDEPQIIPAGIPITAPQIAAKPPADEALQERTANRRLRN